jgi:hypothetical protein
MSDTRFKPEDKSTTLQIYVQPEDEAPTSEPVELEDERRHLKEQAEAEKFWAGRNLGDRKSARIAA